MANGQIKTTKGAIVTEVNGVKYFKLQSKYPGDYTKNCGLLGNEIDENFYFLRSNDIESMAVDESGKLTLTRVDGETLSVNTKEFGVYSFEFDKKRGEITITYPDGTKDVLGGFLVSGRINVASNETLTGNGTVGAPLSIADTERTGTYAPAAEFIDLIPVRTNYIKVCIDPTVENPKFYYAPIVKVENKTIDDKKYFIVTFINQFGEEQVMQVPTHGKSKPAYKRVARIPETPTINDEGFIYILTKNDMPDPKKEGFGKGYRIVTLESIDTFGLLYNFDGVKAIKAALEETGSAWRIPSRQDWAELLNAAEYCPEDRDHNTMNVNEWTGRHAGARLKSINLWKESDIKEKGGYSVGGEDNFPLSGGHQTMHILPLGYGEGSRGAHDTDYDLEAFKKKASYWTSSELNGNKNYASNVYTRTFAYDTRTVLQESSKPSSRLSIRLVRDYDTNNTDVHEQESILGQNYPVTLVINDDTDYSKVWTCVNVGFTNKEFGGVSSKEWDIDLPVTDRRMQNVYFINEWDGSKWEKKQMNEGDSIVLIDGGVDETGETIYNHEWRIYRATNGEIDMYGNEVILVDTALAAKGEMAEKIKELEENLDNEIERAQEAESAITAELRDEEERAQAAESAITEALEEEVERAIEAESAITDELREEEQTRKEVDEALQEEIDALQIVELTDTASTVYKSYGLVNIDGELQGVTIDIPHDKFVNDMQVCFKGIRDYVVDLTIGKITDRGEGDEEYLVIVYFKADGTYDFAEIDLEGLIFENEFKNGLTVDGHDVKVVVDDENGYITSEYDETGKTGYLKVQGLKEEFDRLDNRIDEEISARTEADAVLQQEIDDEVSARTEADAVLQQEIDDEVSARTEADAVLQQEIDDEVSARTQSDENFRAVMGIDEEEFEAQKVDYADYTYVECTETPATFVVQEAYSDAVLHTMYLEGRISEAKGIIYDNAQSKYFELVSRANYIGNETSNKDAINILDEKLKEEESRAIAAEDALNTKIEDEIDRAEAAESAITVALEEEVDRAEAAEQQLQNNIDAEQARAEAEEQRLDGEDIKSEGENYVMTIDGLVINRKSGQNPIKIEFDGNFGGDNLPAPIG